jgi:hypothetical protein
MPMLGVSLIGLSGSAIAALTSCLDRYATGFEKEDGTSFPVEAKDKPKFSRRFSRWFFVRPFLGLLVAPVFVLGIGFFVNDTPQSSRVTRSSSVSRHSWLDSSLNRYRP